MWIRKFSVLFFIFTFSFLSVNLNAQEYIFVHDRVDHQPIKGVEVYNFQKNKQAVSNYDGRINISEFNYTDSIIISHISYKAIITTKKELLELENGVLYMDEKFNMLDGTVVNPSQKFVESSIELPIHIEKISSKEIRLYNPQTSADAIGNMNGVFIQKSQMGGGSPMIRGFAANSVLIVLDGVRINNAIFRSGNLQNVILLDPNVMESAEVLFGAGTVIYGSDALGGVMDFHTFNNEVAEEGEVITKANALLRYSGANQENTFHFDYYVANDKWASFTGLTMSKFSDLRTGSRFSDEYPDFGKTFYYVQTYDGRDSVIKNDDPLLQRHSDYSQANILQKLRYQPSKKFTIEYALHATSSTNIPRFDRLSQYSDTLPKYATWEYGPQKWMMNSVTAVYKDTNRFFNELRTVVAHQYVEESRIDRKLYSENERTRTEKLHIYNFTLDFIKKFNAKSVLLYGIESSINSINSEGVSKNIISNEITEVASRYPDEYNLYQSYAAYALFKRKMGKKLKLLSGLRYNHVILDSRFSGNYYDFPFDEIAVNTSAVNANVGLVYEVKKGFVWNLNLSNGFRAPNLDDIAKVFDSEPGSIVVPNKDLKPEYAYNAEIGFFKSHGDKFRFEGAVFYTYLIDAMVRRDYSFDGKDSIMYDGELSKVQAVVNAGSAHLYGFNLAAYYDISENLNVAADFNWIDGEDLEENVPLRHVTPFFGKATITYKADKFKGSIYTIFNGWKHIDDFAPSEASKTYMYTEDGSPAWYTLNFRLMYQLNDNIQVSGGIENIFDIHYRPYGSGISAPGRNLVVSMRGSF